MKKISIVSLITMLAFSIGLVSCKENKDVNKEFTVLDSYGDIVENSDTTWKFVEEVNAIKIIGNGYTLLGKSEYPIFVEDESVSLLTWKNLTINSKDGYGFSVWNTYGLIITLAGKNNINVNGYSEYLKTEKQMYGNIGIDMGADITFIGNGDLNVNVGKVIPDIENQKAFNCGIYSSKDNADITFSTNGKINLVIDSIKSTYASNVLQVGILADYSIFRITSGEVNIDIKSSIASNAEVNVYGIFGIFAFDGGNLSINVDKRTAYECGDELALFISYNLSSIDFVVDNALSVKSDVGYKFVQKDMNEKVTISASLIGANNQGKVLVPILESDIDIEGNVYPGVPLPMGGEIPKENSDSPMRIYIISLTSGIPSVDGSETNYSAGHIFVVTHTSSIPTDGDGEEPLNSNGNGVAISLPSVVIVIVVAENQASNDGEMPSVQVTTFSTTGSDKHEDDSTIQDNDLVVGSIVIIFVISDSYLSENIIQEILNSSISNNAESNKNDWSKGDKIDLFSNDEEDGSTVFTPIENIQKEPKGQVIMIIIPMENSIYINNSFPQVVMSIDELRPIHVGWNSNGTNAPSVPIPYIPTRGSSNDNQNGVVYLTGSHYDPFFDDDRDGTRNYSTDGFLLVLTGSSKLMEEVDSNEEDDEQVEELDVEQLIKDFFKSRIVTKIGARNIYA